MKISTNQISWILSEVLYIYIYIFFFLGGDGDHNDYINIIYFIFILFYSTLLFTYAEIYRGGGGGRETDGFNLSYHYKALIFL